jgi:transcriptional regulator with XRE-family HTH domain
VDDIAVPTVRQRRVACELAALRQARGWTRDEVARRLGCGPADYRAVERCERAIPPLTLRHLLTQEYKIDDIGYLDYFYALANEGEQRDWTQVFVDPTPEWKRMYIGLNSGASTKHMYNPTLIPGVFQAPDYMATIAQHVLRASKPEMAEGIAGRRARQARLTDQANPLRASAVIGEAAFRVRFPGSDQIMAEQLDHLARVCDLPTVDLRVLPFTVAESKTYSQPFVLLFFPSGEHGIAYLEHLSRTQFLDTPDECGQYQEAFHQLQSVALDQDETADFIHAELAKLGR